jgi:hypothetical protein
VLDLSGMLQKRDQQTQTDDDDKPGPPWSADIAFGQLILTRDKILAPASLNAASDGTRILHAKVSAGAGGQVRGSITPVAGGRRLEIESSDAGAVLLAAGVADNIRGGRLKLTGRYNDAVAHSPLAGSATMDNFRVVDAPAIGRLLQAMTLYGAMDVLRGPGLGFAQAVVPFTWQQRVLHLSGARAFSSSLGLTAQGNLDMRRHVADLDGTIVPAYFFNHLLGQIPLVGRLFSPEAGGGVFAASYSVRGPLKDPHVGVNPLAALTPGVLRKLFGMF